jgi:hypothetical protein
MVPAHGPINPGGERSPPATLAAPDRKPRAGPRDHELRRLPLCGVRGDRVRGPGRHAGEFPVVRGERCSLLAEADVVLFDLDNDPRTRAVVLAAIRATRPELLVVVQSAAPPRGVARGYPTMLRRRRSTARSPHSAPLCCGRLPPSGRASDDQPRRRRKELMLQVTSPTVED